jgi:ParB-like chromosome segregation protein Spo0J
MTKPKIEFPVMKVRMVPAEKVVSNDYNPNHVAVPEMQLLIRSIEADGFTQPVVTFYDPDVDQYVVVDGFHRYRVLKDHFKCDEIPVVVIERDIRERMASTIRHNRARGKHRVDLMAVLVEKMLALGCSELEVAENLGMEAEEVLRLKQQRGIAEHYSHREFSRSWEWTTLESSDATAEPETEPEGDTADVL